MCTCSYHSDVTFPCFYTSGIPWGCTSGVSTLIFSNIIFGNFPIFGVTLKFLLLIGWKLPFFLWVKWLKFIWVCLYNRHPKRLCIGGWLSLGCTFHLVSFLVHLLEFLLYYLPDWHPQRYFWGFDLLNIYSRFLNVSFCPFPILIRGIPGAGLCSAYIKSCAAWKVAYMEDICGILNLFGGNSTVSDILSALVFGVYLLWHL